MHVCWESNNYISTPQQTGHILHLSQVYRVPIHLGERSIMMSRSLSRIDSIAKCMKKAHFSKHTNNTQQVYKSRAYRALNAIDLTVLQHQLKSEVASQKLMELCWCKINEETAGHLLPHVHGRTHSPKAVPVQPRPSHSSQCR